VNIISYLSASEEATVSEPYDYIICGGGTAGCVLAERLSADATKRVLVLEAGRSDYEYIFIRIPAGVLRLFRSIYDWQHESSGEKACNGRNIYFQRGKVGTNEQILIIANNNSQQLFQQSKSNKIN
jgi:choline dehydrogenase-like flavoprotein